MPLPNRPRAETSRSGPGWSTSSTCSPGAHEPRNSRRSPGYAPPGSFPSRPLGRPRRSAVASADADDSPRGRARPAPLDRAGLPTHGPPPLRSSCASRRRRHRWPAAWRARRPAGTRMRPSRGTPARSSWFAGSVPSRRPGGSGEGRATPGWSDVPGPWRQPSWPRQRTPRRPGTITVGNRHQRIDRCGVLAEPALPQGDLR